MRSALILAVAAAVLCLIAYHTYGRSQGRRVFRLDPDAVGPSEALREEVDYVPTKRPMLFGHRFTSIAGTGPIVGPVIAIIWGWVPALIWVLVGSIFMGAVHDCGALVVSLRHQGRSIGDIASDLVNRRVRLLFLLIIFLELWILVAVFGVVIAVVFGVVIAVVFDMYPQAMIPIWLEIPIAVWLGHMIYRRGAAHLPMSIVAVVLRGRPSTTAAEGGPSRSGRCSDRSTSSWPAWLCWSPPSTSPGNGSRLPTPHSRWSSCSV